MNPAGDVAMAVIEEEGNAIILCLPSAKECVCKRVQNFTSNTASGEENGEHENW